jgi:thioredoxin reductase
MMGEAEIVIVGAGPAGASAALRLVKLGLRVLLVDERAQAGGRAFPPPNPDDPLDAPDYRGQALRRGLREHPALLQYRARCHAIAIAPNLSLTLEDAQKQTVQARAIIIATGARSEKTDIPGRDLPGVFALGDCEGLLRAFEAQPRARLVLGGSGPFLWRIAADLLQARRDLVAVVDAAAAPTWRQVWGMVRQPGLLEQGLGWTRTVWSSRAVIHRHSAIVAIKDAHGARVVEIAPSGQIRSGQAGAPRSTVQADLVAYGGPMAPDLSLVQMTGAEIAGAAPRRSAEMETTVPGLFVAGDAGRAAGLDAALAEAAIAAAAVARRFGRGDDAEIQAAEREARARLARLAPFLAAVTAWSGDQRAV